MSTDEERVLAAVSSASLLAEIERRLDALDLTLDAAAWVADAMAALRMALKA
jgi:hypothetical protein